MRGLVGLWASLIKWTCMVTKMRIAKAFEGNLDFPRYLYSNLVSSNIMGFRVTMGDRMCFYSCGISFLSLQLSSICQSIVSPTSPQVP